MRKLITTALVSVMLVCSTRAGNEWTFKHHTFELSVTPAVDYHFITWPGRTPDYKSKVNNLYRPLMAFNFGVAYIYRPIQFIGISAGFNSTEYMIKMGKINYTTTPVGYIDITNVFSGYMVEGYIGVPVLIHAYEQIKGTELELATGPEFLFPVFTKSKYSGTTVYWAGSGIPNQTFNENSTTYNNATQMRENSWLAWTVQLTANVPVKNVFTIAIGPEMKFLTVHPLDTGPYYNQESHEIDYYVGCKVGFRLGTDGHKSATTAQSKSN